MRIGEVGVYSSELLGEFSEEGEQILTGFLPHAVAPVSGQRQRMGMPQHFLLSRLGTAENLIVIFEHF